MPDELTEELLADLSEPVRKRVIEALVRKRAEDALGKDAAEYLRTISKGLEELSDKVLAHIEANEAAHAALAKEFDDGIRAVRRDIRASGAGQSTLQTVIAEGCKLTNAALKIVMDRPVALGVLVFGALVLVGLTIVSSGGKLTASWRDVGMILDRGENATEHQDDVDAGAEPGSGPVAPVGDGAAP